MQCAESSAERLTIAIQGDTRSVRKRLTVPCSLVPMQYMALCPRQAQVLKSF